MPAEFRKAMDAGALVVDTSMPAAFGGAHIEGAYSIWLDGLPSFAGRVLPYDCQSYWCWKTRHILRRRCGTWYALVMIRSPVICVAGQKPGTMLACPLQAYRCFRYHELKEMLARREKLAVLDVRDQAEWESGHIEGSVHVYVGYLEKRLSEVPKDQPVAVTCSVGHRAGLAASILLKAAYPRVYNVLGGMRAWHAASYPLTKD